VGSSTSRSGRRHTSEFFVGRLNLLLLLSMSLLSPPPPPPPPLLLLLLLLLLLHALAGWLAGA
jgi:hypothetical protein